MIAGKERQLNLNICSHIHHCIHTVETLTCTGIYPHKLMIPQYILLSTLSLTNSDVLCCHCFIFAPESNNEKIYIYRSTCSHV